MCGCCLKPDLPRSHEVRSSLLSPPPRSPFPGQANPQASTPSPGLGDPVPCLECVPPPVHLEGPFAFPNGPGDTSLPHSPPCASDGEFSGREPGWPGAALAGSLVSHCGPGEHCGSWLGPSPSGWQRAGGARACWPQSPRETLPPFSTVILIGHCRRIVGRCYNP